MCIGIGDVEVDGGRVAASARVAGLYRQNETFLLFVIQRLSHGDETLSVLGTDAESSADIAAHQRILKPRILVSIGGSDG